MPLPPLLAAKLLDAPATALGSLQNGALQLVVLISFICLAIQWLVVASHESHMLYIRDLRHIWELALLAEPCLESQVQLSACLRLYMMSVLKLSKHY